VDGTSVDPGVAISSRREFYIDAPSQKGPVKAKVVVYFWSRGRLNEMFLCTADGLAVHESESRVREPSLSFSVYIQSDYFKGQTEDGSILLEGMDETASKLRERARYCLKQAIGELLAKQAQDTIAQLRAEGSYPYSGEPKDELEKVERQVFDVAAQKLHELSPTLQDAAPPERRLKMQVLAAAVEQSKSARDRIVQKVFELNPKQQQEFAEILDRVDLGSVVGLVSEVVDRLDFLTALHLLTYHPEAKKRLKERSQLHKILLRDLWIFGEQYRLGTSDSSLRNVLKEHIKMLGRKDLAPEWPLTDARLDKIPDLMLYSQYAIGREGEYERLVVELKAPKVNLGQKELMQIANYAQTVANHAGHSGDKTRWKFVVVSGKIDRNQIEPFVSQEHRDPALISDKGTYTIWAYEWGTLIQEAKWRMEHLRQVLRYEMTDDTAALDFLKSHHSNLVPKEVQDLKP